MTSVEPLVYYPAYCFHLSPTINKWCPLRATDIHGLECRPGFEGDNVFFSSNHPIRWVRIVGVVVAIDEYYGHRNYTIDDSTGACIECCIDIPKPAKSLPQNGTAWGALTVAPAPTSAPDPYSDIDVGMVVEVKGSTKLFRDQKQISVQKMQRTRSTNQEVQFWNKISDFRREVLSQPWMLEKREVRRCKKQHMADVDAEERRRKRKEEKRKEEKRKEEKRKEMGYVINGGAQKQEAMARDADTRRKPTRREPRTQPETGHPYTEGQYNALGL
ncbi:hypothetical protein GGS26DRAFT_256299 [Hypomontagnella submonticulosa]|nr:hypothetical protein GGS26DRAFT_256299 [Hypomontagnella submonticulosa]